MPLTAKQRQHLRALAHHLDPVVQVGHEGITEAVLAQIDEAVGVHELIKVRLGTECPVPRDEAATAIGAGARCELVQLIGRIVVVYRRKPKKPKVTVPGQDTSKDAGERKGTGSKGRKPRGKKKRIRRSRDQRMRAKA